MTDIDLTIPAILDRNNGLPARLLRIRDVAASAGTAAEMLEAGNQAGAIADHAKREARFLKAKGAADELIAKAHRIQAEALEIEADTRRRLADEYDAAQQRGEVAKNGDNLPSVPKQNSKPTAADLGLSRKAIHEARLIRDAEKAEPGIVKATLAEAIEAGEEPTRAKVRRAVVRTVHRDEPAARPKQGRAAVVARVNSAIAMLTGLPSAAEVVGYLSGTDEAVLIGEHLPAAVRWLAEFAEMWPEEATDAEAAE